MGCQTDRQEANTGKVELVSNSPDETAGIGRRIAEALLCKGQSAAGTIIALKGTLGSGKTHLTRGIAGGLGIN